MKIWQLIIVSLSGLLQGCLTSEVYAHADQNNFTYVLDSYSIKNAYIDSNNKISICFNGYEELNKVKKPRVYMASFSKDQINSAINKRAENAIHSFIGLPLNEIKECGTPKTDTTKVLPIIPYKENVDLESLQKEYGNTMYIAEYNRYLAAIPVHEEGNTYFVLVNPSGYSKKSVGRKIQIATLYPLAILGDVATSPVQLIYFLFVGNQSWK